MVFNLLRGVKPSMLRFGVFFGQRGLFWLPAWPWETHVLPLLVPILDGQNRQSPIASDFGSRTQIAALFSGCRKRSAAKGVRSLFFVFGMLSVTFRSLFLMLLSLFSSLFCQTPFAGLLLRQGDFSQFCCIGVFKTNRQSRVSNRSFKSQRRQRFESRVIKLLAILDWIARFRPSKVPMRWGAAPVKFNTGMLLYCPGMYQRILRHCYQ